MATLVKFICVLITYLLITFGDIVTKGTQQKEELRNDYRNYLNEKNRIECSAISVVETLSVDNLISKVSGKGYAFEEVEKPIKEFKQKYINKMIKIKGRIKRVNLQERTIIFENNVDCLWAAINVRSIVDDPTLYKEGEIVSIVGRCLGMDCLGNIYIDGGQIEQDIPSDYIEAYSSVNKRYDEAMTVKYVLQLYNTYGDSNILFSQIGNKTIQLDGYVASADSGKVVLESFKGSDPIAPMVYINYPGAKYSFHVGEEVKINATYKKFDPILNRMFFDAVY